ncbi:MAG: putative ABC transporter permease subunit [Limisphaerales bacterium]
MFRVLVFIRLRMLWNGVWKISWKYRLLGLLAAAGMSVFFTGIFFLGLNMFRVLAGQPEWGLLLAEIILFFGCAGVLLFFFISTAASAASTLFLSKDLEFLFSLPVKPRTVFAAKLVEALFIAFAFIPFLFLPFLLGYGIGYGAPFYYYPASILILVSLLVWGACFGLVIAFFIVRILPTHRANEIITAVVSLIAVSFAFSFQFLAGRFDDRPSTEWAKIEAWQPLMELGKKLLHGPLEFLPSSWAQSALFWVSGQGPSGGWKFLLLTGSAVLLFFAVVLSAEKIYERGWISASPKTKKKRRPLEKAVLAEEKFFSPFWGVVKKDWQSLKRDVNQIISALVMPAVMVVIPLVVSARRDTGQQMEQFLPFFVTLLAGVVALQNGLRAVPGERLSMSQILVMPLPKPAYVRAKLFFASLCTLAELWVAAVLLTVVFSLEIKQLFLGLWLSFFIAASAGGIGLWIGTVFARWDWDKPNHMVTPGGAFALAGIILLYGLLWTGLLTAGAAALKFLPFAVTLVLGSIIFGAVSFFLVWLFGVLTVKRLENLEWKFG